MCDQFVTENLGDAIGTLSVDEVHLAAVKQAAGVVGAGNWQMLRCGHDVQRWRALPAFGESPEFKDSVVHHMSE